MALVSSTHIRTSRDGVIGRRSFLQSVAASASVLGFKDALTLQAAELRQRGMACILLFMRGGPSQLETFDPKPGHANGGPTKAIPTDVPGVQIAEHWPHVAKAMKDIALVR